MIGISATDAIAHWDQIAPLVSRVIDRLDLWRYFNVDHVRSKVEAQEWQCWIVEDPLCMFITSVDVHPSGYKVLTVRMASGEGLTEWAGAVDETLRDFARANGCGEIQFEGRKGWQRAFQSRIEYRHRIEV